MTKRFWFSTLGMFVLFMATDFLLHGVLLHADYLRLPLLMRTEADSQHYFGWMLLAHALLSGAFVWIYQRGREERPWLGQGLRFGLAVALLAMVPTYLIYYVAQPLPGLLVIKQVLFDFVRMLLMGAAVAFLNR